MKKIFFKIIKRFKKHWKILAGIFLLLFILWLNCLPTQLFNSPTSTVLVDSEGRLMNATIASDGQWRFPGRDTVPYKFEKCIIQFEDKTFYKHLGVSPQGISRALIQNVKNGRVVSGGSTITMQVIRMSRGKKSRSIYQKLVEMIWATRLEWRLSKKEILAMYTMHAPMGGNVVGLDAAAWRYFNQKPEDLSWGQSATLAVLPNAPGLIHPGRNRAELIRKRNFVLQGLYDEGVIDSTTLILAKAEPIPDAPNRLPQTAPHLHNKMVKDGLGGQLVKSTLDYNLQNKVQQVVNNHHDQLSKKKIYNAAVIVVDVNTGAIKSYIGNTEKINNEDHGNDVDIITAPRSSGSILKPFLYAGMMSSGKMTPSSLLPDIPSSFSGYSPLNYTQKFDGMVHADIALARSLNIPAVYMLREHGASKFHAELKKLGMTTLNNAPSHYGLSLILGGAEVKLWDLANMYSKMGRTLNQFPHFDKTLNTNIYYNSKSIESKGATTPLYSAGAVHKTFKAMLNVVRPQDDVNWKIFSSSRKIAWKTGTSFGFRDAWAVGLDANYLVAVWVGNADGEGRPELIGVNTAGPLLFDVFDLLSKPEWFSTPYDDMNEIAVCTMSGKLPTQNCEILDTIYAPIASVNSKPCTYHTLIHLNKTQTNRVNRTCVSSDDIVTKSWFVLPPHIEKYFIGKNPNYRKLPPYLYGCKDKQQQQMKLIYPKNNSKLYIPIELDGEKGETIFEVAITESQKALFWHLDDKFIGQTQGVHQITMRPSYGEHELTVVDQNGNRVGAKFEVLSDEE